MTFKLYDFIRWKTCCYVTMPIHLLGSCEVATTVALDIASAKC